MTVSRINTFYEINNLPNMAGYHQFLRKSIYRRYGIFFVTLFFMISSIKAYMNNTNIETSIIQVKENIVAAQQKNLYLERFYKPYLTSSYSSYFYGHENGILHEGEKNLHFKHRIPEEQAVSVQEQLPHQPLDLSTPQAAWHHFRQTKIIPSRQGKQGNTTPELQ